MCVVTVVTLLMPGRKKDAVLKCVCALAGRAWRFITAPASPERLQPAWRPGPFIPGSDWTRASRRVGLQQFCRAQILLPSQSKPLAGHGICCLTFLIYTSPPSHTHRVPFTAFTDPAITIYNCGGGVEVSRLPEMRSSSVTCLIEFGEVHVEVTAVGRKLFISQRPSVHLMIAWSKNVS